MYIVVRTTSDWELMCDSLEVVQNCLTNFYVLDAAELWNDIYQ